MSAYGFDEAEQELHDCIKSRKNANHYIVRLGLVQVNSLASKPKFHTNSVVADLYDATKRLKTNIADNNSPDKLESRISVQFVDDITKPLIDVYGNAVWGLPRSRAEQKVSDLYPERLDISNTIHLSKIKVYLFCWICKQAMMRMKRNSSGTDLSPETTRSDPTSRTMKDYRRVEHGFLVPALGSPSGRTYSCGDDDTRPASLHDTTSTECQIPQVQTYPRGDYGVPTAPMATMISAKKGYTLQEPVQPVIDGREPLADLDPILSRNASSTHDLSDGVKSADNSNRRIDLSEDEAEGPHEDAPTGVPSSRKRHLSGDDSERDPDYVPRTTPGSGKRRRKSDGQNLGKLAKLRLPNTNVNNQLRQQEDIYSDPEASPVPEQCILEGERGTRDPVHIRFTPFIDEEEQGTRSPARQLNFPNLTPAIEETIQNQQPSCNDRQGITRGDTSPREGVAISNEREADHSCYGAPSDSVLQLRDLLDVYFEPNREGNTNYEQLVKALKLRWEQEGNNLKRKFGQSYADRKLSFDEWTGLLERVNEFRAKTDYHGQPGEDWNNYLSNLQNPSLRWTTFRNLDRLRAWVRGVGKGTSPNALLESFSGDLALIIHVLAQLSGSPSVEDIAELVRGMNKALLVWLTY